MTGTQWFLTAVGERVFTAALGAAILGAAVWAVTRGRGFGLTPALRAWLWWLVAAKAIVALVWALPVSWPGPWPTPPSLVESKPSVTLDEAATPGAELSRPGTGAPVGVAGAVGSGEARLSRNQRRSRSRGSTASAEESDAAAIEPRAADRRPGVGASWSAASDWAGTPAVGTLAAVLGALWLLGVAASLALGWRHSSATIALLRQATGDPDAALLRRVRGLADRLGYRGRIRVRHSAALDCPAVAGVWRPSLLLPPPERELDPEQWDLALAHELVHLRRRDLLWGLLPALAERLFFFHPLVRRAAREYAFAREAACDLAVIAELGPPPERYGRLLLRLGVRPLRPGWTLAAASPTHDLLKRRLEMLHESRLVARFTPARLGLLAGVVALAAVPWRFAESATAMMMPGVPDPVAVYGEAGRSAASLSAPVKVEPGSVEPGFAEPNPVPPSLVEPSFESVEVEPGHTRAASSSSSRSSTHSSESGTAFGYYGDEMAFALLRGAGDSNVSFTGDTRGLEEAKRLRRAGEDVLWFRLGSKAYVVRDRSALNRFEALLAPQQQLGAEQGKLGERQGELGAKQADLGERQGELGARQGEIGARQARLTAELLRSAGAEASRALRGRATAAGDAAAGDPAAGDPAAGDPVGGLARKMEQLAKEQARLGEAQAELGARQAELGARHAELGRLHARLGEQQAEAAAAFEAEAARALEDFVSRGLAVEVR